MVQCETLLLCYKKGYKLLLRVAMDRIISNRIRIGSNQAFLSESLYRIGTNPAFLSDSLYRIGLTVIRSDGPIESDR